MATICTNQQKHHERLMPEDKWLADLFVWVLKHNSQHTIPLCLFSDRGNIFNKEPMSASFTLLWILTFAVSSSASALWYVLHKEGHKWICYNGTQPNILRGSPFLGIINAQGAVGVIMVASVLNVINYVTQALQLDRNIDTEGHLGLSDPEANRSSTKPLCTQD